MPTIFFIKSKNKGSNIDLQQIKNLLCENASKSYFLNCGWEIAYSPKDQVIAASVGWVKREARNPTFYLYQKYDFQNYKCHEFICWVSLRSTQPTLASQHGSGYEESI